MFWTTNTPIIANGNWPIIVFIKNQRANAPWGDPLVEKLAKVTRIYGLNINGLNWTNLAANNWMSYVKLSTKFKPMYFVAKSTNWILTILKFCRFFIKQPDNIGNVHKSLLRPCQIHSQNSQYKPGGTFLITAHDLTGQVIVQKQDKWWRWWVSQVYQGRGSIKIAIYSAYQPGSGKRSQVGLHHNSFPTAQPPLAGPRSDYKPSVSLSEGHYACSPS